MSYLGRDFGKELEQELSKGYDVLRIARMALSAYQDHCREVSSDLYKRMFQVIAMEEGPEFELSAQQLRELVKSLESDLGI
jgi:hypothetical protein